MTGNKQLNDNLGNERAKSVQNILNDSGVLSSESFSMELKQI